VWVDPPKVVVEDRDNCTIARGFAVTTLVTSSLRIFR